MTDIAIDTSAIVEVLTQDHRPSVFWQPWMKLVRYS